MQDLASSRVPSHACLISVLNMRSDRSLFPLQGGFIRVPQKQSSRQDSRPGEQSRHPRCSVFSQSHMAAGPALQPPQSHATCDSRKLGRGAPDTSRSTGRADPEEGCPRAAEPLR